MTVPNPEKNTTNSDLWVVRADGSAPPRRLTSNEGADGSPSFSPDGTRLAFVSKRGDGPPQLYLLPLSGGDAERITDLPVGVDDPKWFPDGASIAFVASTWPDLNGDFASVKKRLDENDKDKVKAKITENRLVRYWDHYLTDGQYPHLFRVSLRLARDRGPDSRERALHGLDGDRRGYDIAPDASEIAFSANATQPPYATLNYDVFTVKLPGGTVEDRTRGNPADDHASPLHAGRTVHRSTGSRRALKSTRTSRAWRGSTATRGRARSSRRRSTPKPPIGRCRRTASSSTSRRDVGARSPSTPSPRRAASPRSSCLGSTTGNVAATSQGALVFTRQSLTSPTELWRAEADGTGQKSLTAFDDEKMKAFDMGPRPRD